MNVAFERTEQKDEWLTPPHIFEAVQPFDLDVCQPINPPWSIAPKGFNVNDDGLSQSWGGVHMVQSSIRKRDIEMAQTNEAPQ